MVGLKIINGRIKCGFSLEILMVTESIIAQLLVNTAIRDT
jgi:hypothetical protein